MKVISLIFWLWPYFWLWYFSSYLISAEPLLFESVGNMASSLSYLHTQIPINLSALEDKITEYRNTILTEFTEQKLFDTLNKYYKTKNINPPTQNKFHIHPLYQWKHVAKAHIHEVDTLYTDLEALLLLLPHPPNKTEKYFTPEMHEFYSHLVHNNPKASTIDKIPPRKNRRSSNETSLLSRPKRFLPVVGIALAVLIPGIIGTVMGAVSNQKLNALYEEVKTNTNNINRLFTLTETQAEKINEIISSVSEIQMDLHDQSIFEPSVFLAKLSKTTAEIRHFIHKATHAIQQAQHRRLAIDYLNAPELSKLFFDLRDKADKYDCELVVNSPSDLFQLEVTYFFDGAVLTLLLHTPMTPKNAILRLFRLHPFPLPFFGETFIIPNVKNDLLAISNTDHRYSIQLSSSDLVSCLRVNHIYLCERNGVLAKSYTDTCLGSLYSQQYEEARKLCSFIIQPSQEFFYQLQQNWFLAYFPEKQVLPLSCRNGTKSEMHFKASVTKFHLSPGCTLESSRYRLVSDLSLSIPADYIHLDMDWDPVQFFPHPASEVIPELDKLRKLNISRLSLADLRQSLTVSRLPFSSFHSVHFSFHILTISIFTFMVLLCLFRCRASQLDKRQAARESASPQEVAMKFHNLQETDTHKSLLRDSI